MQGAITFSWGIGPSRRIRICHTLLKKSTTSQRLLRIRTKSTMSFSKTWIQAGLRRRQTISGHYLSSLIYDSSSFRIDMISILKTDQLKKLRIDITLVQKQFWSQKDRMNTPYVRNHTILSMRFEESTIWTSYFWELKVSMRVRRKLLRILKRLTAELRNLRRKRELLISFFKMHNKKNINLKRMKRKTRKSQEFIFDLKRCLLLCLQVGHPCLLKRLKFSLKNLEFQTIH